MTQKDTLQNRKKRYTLLQRAGNNQERKNTMLKRNELTSDERLLYMPIWERVVLGVFVAVLPIIGSIAAINF